MGQMYIDLKDQILLILAIQFAYLANHFAILAIGQLPISIMIISHATIDNSRSSFNRHSGSQEQLTGCTAISTYLIIIYY